MPLQTNGVATANATLNTPLTSLPPGATATWLSSDTNVATVQQSAANPLQASITPVAPGTSTITCKVTNADGSSSSGAVIETVVPAPSANVTSVIVTLVEQNG